MAAAAAVAVTVAVAVAAAAVTEVEAVVQYPPVRVVPCGGRGVVKEGKNAGEGK